VLLIVVCIMCRSKYTVYRNRYLLFLTSPLGYVSFCICDVAYVTSFSVIPLLTQEILYLWTKSIAVRISQTQASFNNITFRNMDSRTIFSALCDRATAAAVAATIELPSSSSSPLHFAQRFSDAIVESLNSAEIQAVFDFLSPQNLSMVKGGDLSPKFKKMRQGFEKEELPLSEKEPLKLVQHSGPLDAGVGVVLHVQHYKPEDEDAFIARPFWDLHIQSVQVLAQKGFSDAFTFCIDWHWRAAGGSLGCPMKSLGRKLRACHDSFSLYILDLIPCPLLIIGGACAWESYTKAIPKSSKIVSFS